MVLLSASVDKFSVSRMGDLKKCILVICSCDPLKYNNLICLPVIVYFLI